MHKLFRVPMDSDEIHHHYGMWWLVTWGCNWGYILPDKNSCYLTESYSLLEYALRLKLCIVYALYRCGYAIALHISWIHSFSQTHSDMHKVCCCMSKKLRLFLCYTTHIKLYPRQYICWCIETLENGLFKSTCMLHAPPLTCRSLRFIPLTQPSWYSSATMTQCLF